MNTQFKKGIVELCVLSLLVEEDMYGYNIISKLSTYIDVSENTIYPILRRLTKDHYCRTYLVESNAGAPRKYYALTEEGFAHFMGMRQEWDTFIGGVYEIIHKGGIKNEAIFERFKKRIKEEKTQRSSD